MCREAAADVEEEAAEPWDTGSRPARRAEVALLFLVQEGGRQEDAERTRR